MAHFLALFWLQFLIYPDYVPLNIYNMRPATLVIFMNGSDSRLQEYILTGEFRRGLAAIHTKFLDHIKTLQDIYDFNLLFFN